MRDLATRLFCLGDLHLGRASGRIPAGVSASVDQLSPRAAWRRAVAVAGERGVQAVILAGDVVDAANDRFEAYGELQAGVSQLLAAGIRVVAVAGNHDSLALPRLADLLPGFELLGRGGRWEETAIEGPGGRVRLVGWSFPARRQAQDPTADGLPAAAVGGPTIGLLHGDLDQPESDYAPVASANLRAAGYDLWLLGHRHTPTLTMGDAKFGYLGSVVGLDPTETGIHGAWLLEVSGRSIRASVSPLAPLRWHRLDVDITGIDPAGDELPAHILAAIRDAAAASAQAWGEALVVGCRVRLTGRARNLAALERIARSEAVVGQVTAHDGREYFVDDVEIAARLDHDLALLAQGDTPPAVLARRLLSLRDGADPTLLAVARREIEELQRRQFAAIAAPVADDELKARLWQAGLRALDALLAQREVPGGSA